MNTQTKYKFKVPSSLFITKKNIFLIVGSVLSTALSVATSLVLGSIVSAVSQESWMTGKTIAFVGVLFLSLVSAVLVLIFKGWFPVRAAIIQRMSCTTQVIQRVIAMPARVYKKHEKGYYMNLLSSSATMYGSVYSAVNIAILSSVGCIAVILLALLITNYVYFIVVLTYIPILFLVTRVPAKRIADLQRNIIPAQDRYLNESKRIVENKRAINIARADAFYKERYHDIGSRYLDSIKKYRFNEGLNEKIPSSMCSLLQIIMLALTIEMYQIHAASVGDIFISYQLCALIQNPLAELFQSIMFVKANKVHLERLQNTFKESQEPSGYEKLWNSSLKPAVKIGEGTLLATPEGPELFHTQALSIPQGSLVVVRGSNGSGKSSFVDLLAGCSDPSLFSGDIELSDDLKDCSRFARPVPLVEGSLADNMFGEKIDRAVYNLLDFSSLETHAFDGKEESVSLGERQKIGLLRALSRKQGALVLDEPLQNLDAPTAQRLCRYLANLKGGRTVVVIMHSDELDQEADVLLDIQDGQLHVR